ncbi:MAG TPA: cytochrome P450, partial [Luteolibacter sp.]
FNTGEDAETVEKAMRVILPHVFSRLGHLVNWPAWLPTPANRRFRRSLEEVDRVVYRIIDRHRQAQVGGGPDTDLLAMLMRVRDAETGAGLDDSQLRNETITFLLAGHETTANALTWIFYLISRHPEVERRLSDELAAVLGGRVPVLDDVPKLAYTKRVIQEAMRLYPPIWIIERRVIREDVIGGFTLPAGSAVVISPYALHRHPAFWERPEEFDPDRFLSPPPAAYIPFGAGPRFCIGNEFAMLEAQLITAMVMQAYQLRLVPGHPVQPQPDITLRSKHGMRMTLHPR